MWAFITRRGLVLASAMVATGASVGLAAVDARSDTREPDVVAPVSPSSWVPPVLPASLMPQPQGVAFAMPRWSWPLWPRPVVLRRFRAPATRYGPGHRGLDLSAAPGQAVRAVDDGIVTHAARLAGRGTVTIRHAFGLRSTYEPVRASVRPGQHVARGEVIGTVETSTVVDTGTVLERSTGETGSGHCGERPCIHLGALLGSTYRDPLPLLVRGVVLLPVPEPGPGG